MAASSSPSKKIIINEGTPHAVSRTAELLSCARTALKIAKSQNPPPTETDWWFVEPSQLRLHHSAAENASTINNSTKNIKNFYSTINTSKSTIIGENGGEFNDTLEDALSLLRAMQASLETLEGLVRRRGHVNDPTQEIAMKTRQLEADAQELNAIVLQLQATRHVRSKQHKKHLEWIATWLQTFASQQTNRLKEILKVRAMVLADQAQRRKLWNPSAASSLNHETIRKKAALESSPLFTMTPATIMKVDANKMSAKNDAKRFPANGRPVNGTGTVTATTNGTSTSNGGGGGVGRYGRGGVYGAYGSTGGYGGGAVAAAGYGGYYGGASSSVGGATGMRQRRNNNNAPSATAMVQEQVQIRQQQRETESRLESTKQTEKSLAELSTLFGKMSNLIVQQGETLEKVEDDVEAALLDVTAGQAEIQTLYSLKKGNRSLIIKVFCVVIFVILFMRLY